MNSFSGYLGLPNISYVTADDLDIANLAVDTITVNTELKTDNIQPLTNTSSITVGLNTNTGVIDFQQDVDVNADLEANNITTIGQINADNIQPLLSNSNLIIGTTTNTGIIDIRQNITAPTVGITTANITTENTTTSNTTNLNTNNIQPRLVSSAVSLYTTGTGAITLGNSTTGTGITINDITTFSTGKDLLFSSTGRIRTDRIVGSTPLTSDINIGYTDPVYTAKIQLNQNVIVNRISASKLVLTNANKQLVSSLYTDTDFVRLTANNAFSGNNTFSGTSTFNNTILGNTITGTTAGSSISLYGTTTSTIGLGNVSGGTFSINPNTTMNGNLTMASGKTITLNATGGKVLCNTLTGTTTSSTIEIGESGDTGLIRTRKDLYIGSTPFGSNKGIYCNYFDVLSPTDNIIFCATQTTGAITIQPSASGSTGNIFIGNSSNPALDTSGLYIYKSTTLATNKNLTLSSTGILAVNTISATSTTATGSLFSNILGGAINIGTGLTGSMNIGTSMLNGILTLGSASFNPAVNTGYMAINLPLYTNQGLSVNTGKNIVLSSTGTIYSNNILPALTSAAVNLFTDHLFNINIGNNASGGDVFFNQNVKLITGKNLSLTSGYLFVNAIEPYNTGISDTFSIASQFNTQPIYIGFNQSSGNIILGNGTPASDSGDLIINKDTVLGTNKTLTLDSGGRIICGTYDSISAIYPLAIGSTNTTGLIRIGGALTSGILELGTIGVMTGGIRCNGDLTIGNILQNKGIVCNFFNALQDSDLVRFSQNLLTGNIRIGEKQTTGGITIGHQTPASDSGTLTINKTTVLAANKTLTLNATGGTLTTSTIQANSATSGTNNLYANITTGTTLNIGTAATTSIINVGTGLTTGRLKLYNNRIHIGAGAGSTTTTGASTQALYCVAIGTNSQQTNAGINSIAIGANAGQTNQTANSIVLNASGIALNGNQAGFFVRPIRLNNAAGTYYVVYDTGNYEVCYYTSGKKYKTDIQPFNDTSTILQLECKSYFDRGSGSKRIGFIAEEVYDIDPNLSTQDPDGKPDALEYFTMISYLVNEVKKLRKEFDEYKLSHP